MLCYDIKLGRVKLERIEQKQGRDKGRVTISWMDAMMNDEEKEFLKPRIGDSDAGDLTLLSEKLHDLIRARLRYGYEAAGVSVPRDLGKEDHQLAVSAPSTAVSGLGAKHQFDTSSFLEWRSTFASDPALPDRLAASPEDPAPCRKKAKR